MQKREAKSNSKRVMKTHGCQGEERTEPQKRPQEFLGRRSTGPQQYTKDRVWGGGQRKEQIRLEMKESQNN